jgi:ribosomal protein L7/L12
MSEKLCGTCKWFARLHPRFVYEGERIGICAMLAEGSEKAMFDIQVSVDITGERKVNLICVESFGCVLWEAKETVDE